MSDSASQGSRPASPLAPDERIYKPLPKRFRSDAPRTDGEATWAHGVQSLDDDLHPALDTATSSTENDQEGPATPPQTTPDPLGHSSIFSSVHHLVKDAAAASKLFSGAAPQIGAEALRLPSARQTRARDGDDDGSGAEEELAAYSQYAAQGSRGHTAGQFARLAAAAGLLVDDPDRRDDDDRDRDDDYGSRRGGANKKKRKVPSAANGHAFTSSPPDSPVPLPAPASVNGVGGLSREKQRQQQAETGMRADFATAMVGVVKAMGSVAAGRYTAAGGRIPHSSHESRKPPRRRPAKQPVSTAPAPILRTKTKKPGKAVAEPQIQLPNLFDPSLGSAVSAIPDAALVPAPKKGAPRPPPVEEPPFHFFMPESDFTFECPAPKLIATRIVELDRERAKLKRARELILARARELESVRQRALDDEVKPKKLLPSTKVDSGKTFVEVGLQTDGPAGGREIWVTPRTAPAPSNAPKKPPPRKGKKKRSAHANANNVHHRDNYVPSRPVRTAPPREAQSTAVPLLRPGASLDLVDPNSPFYAAGPEAHPQLGISMLAPFFAGAEEWLCGFCESRILYGSSANVSEAVRKRKGVLKVRKRAQERAAKAAAGQSGKTAPKAKGKMARARPTHDVSCGPGESEVEA